MSRFRPDQVIDLRRRAQRIMRPREEPRGSRRLRLPRTGLIALLALLGPGLIAGTAGDDAGGIATYASVGAEYGYALIWALILVTISLALIQDMAARMGAVTGKGFADLVREQFGVRVTAFVMLTLVIANASLVVSEFVGIAAAAELFHISRYIAVPLMALLLWGLILRGSYPRVEKVFLVMTLAFFTYPIAAIVARPHWAEVGRQVIHPTLQLNASYVTLFIALVGTTITPYMQIYLQSATAEKGAHSLGRSRVDAYFGAIFSDLIAAFIIIATGATLFLSHTTIETAADAARALEPVAGSYAGVLFGVGLFGASALAAAVLPLATAYPVTEAFGLERGVSRSIREAPVFHGLFTGLIVLGAAIALIPGLNVIRVLVYTQVLNGLLLPIELIAMLRIVDDPEVMGEHTNSRVYDVAAWLTVIVVVSLSTVYLVIAILGIFGVQVGG